MFLYPNIFIAAIASFVSVFYGQIGLENRPTEIGFSFQSLHQDI